MLVKLHGQEKNLTTSSISNLKESLQAAYVAEDRLKGLLQREGLLP